MPGFSETEHDKLSVFSREVSWFLQMQKTDLLTFWVMGQIG